MNYDAAGTDVRTNSRSRHPQRRPKGTASTTPWATTVSAPDTSRASVEKLRQSRRLNQRSASTDAKEPPRLHSSMLVVSAGNKPIASPAHLVSPTRRQCAFRKSLTRFADNNVTKLRPTIPPGTKLTRKCTRSRAQQHEPSWQAGTVVVRLHARCYRTHSFQRTATRRHVVIHLTTSPEPEAAKPNPGHLPQWPAIWAKGHTVRFSYDDAGRYVTAVQWGRLRQYQVTPQLTNDAGRKMMDESLRDTGPPTRLQNGIYDASVGQVSRLNLPGRGKRKRKLIRQHTRAPWKSGGNRFRSQPPSTHPHLRYDGRPVLTRRLITAVSRKPTKVQ